MGLVDWSNCFEMMPSPLSGAEVKWTTREIGYRPAHPCMRSVCIFRAEGEGEHQPRPDSHLVHPVLPRCLQGLPAGADIVPQFRPSRGPRPTLASTRHSRISSSVNRVHDRNTGNGGGRMPSGSFNLNDILALSKTSLMEMDTPPVDTQALHLVGNVCIDLG